MPEEGDAAGARRDGGTAGATGCCAYHPLMHSEQTLADVADQLHAALTAAGSRGSVRVLGSGQWIVRLLRGLSSQGYAYPPSGPDRDEWLTALVARLEFAVGVRPELETED